MIVKGVFPSSLQKLSITTPFCQAQFVFKEGRSDLLRFHDGTILHEHLELRSSYSHLEAAGRMAKALLDSQLPGRPSHALFALFARYLKEIPSCPSPHSLTSSFLLKMLLLEGLITLGEQDNLPSHFSPEEKELISELTLARSFQKLATCEVASSLATKIEAHFFQSIRAC